MSPLCEGYMLELFVRNLCEGSLCGIVIWIVNGILIIIVTGFVTGIVTGIVSGIVTGIVTLHGNHALWPAFVLALWLQLK